MKPDPHLEQYLALCKRMYLRMQQENAWPWEATDADAEGSDTSDQDARN